MRVAMFSSKPYDRAQLHRAQASAPGHELQFPRAARRGARRLPAGPRLSARVCLFVNDTCDARTLDLLAHGGTGLVALRWAGFNHRRPRAGRRPACGIPVVRVPAYSPHAVAEFTRRPDPDPEPPDPPRLQPHPETTISRWTACWSSTCTARRSASSAPARSARWSPRHAPGLRLRGPGPRHRSRSRAGSDRCPLPDDGRAGGPGRHPDAALPAHTADSSLGRPRPARHTKPGFMLVNTSRGALATPRP